MGCPKLLLFLYPCLIQFLVTAIAQSNEILQHFCLSNSTDNKFSNSTYSSNINQAFASVISLSSTNNNGFYNVSLGQNSDQVFSIALCRGDTSLDACNRCIIKSTRRLRLYCPNSKEAIIWYDNCMLRYSNRNILNNMESGPNFWTYNENNISDSQVSEFNQTVYDLLDKLTSQAASGSSLRKFKTGNEATKSNQITIYALAQCTPDISMQDCRYCLNKLMARLPECCVRRTSGIKRGARILSPSCNFRYAKDYPFYDPTLLEAPPLPPTDPGTNNKDTRRTVIIIVSSVISVLQITGCACAYFKHRKTRKRVSITSTLNREDLDESSGPICRRYTYETIRYATDNFSNDNKLGEGGFGSVYKGILPSGQEVAVKRLSSNSKQGGDVQFENEVKLLARLHHRNLVRLLGFCFEENEKLLIYELIPNSSLDCFIFDERKRFLLDWMSRLKIIVGIARGLLYLHQDSQPRITHRDLKLGNILLDEFMNPKIADFGTARLFEIDQSQATTTKVVGTLGYMAPESFRGIVSAKLDVFSFGVLVLEIISGQNITKFQDGEEERDLVTYAWDNWNKGSVANILDPVLMEASSRTEILRCVHIAFLCLQEDPLKRPTMASVILMLDSNTFVLAKPSKPAYLMHSDTEQNSSSFQESTTAGVSQIKQDQFSVNETSITELGPR